MKRLTTLLGIFVFLFVLSVATVSAFPGVPYVGNVGAEAIDINMNLLGYSPIQFNLGTHTGALNGAANSAVSSGGAVNDQPTGPLNISIAHIGATSNADQSSSVLFFTSILIWVTAFVFWKRQRAFQTHRGIKESHN